MHFSFSNACRLVQVLIDSGAPEDVVMDILGGDFLEGCGPDVLLEGEAHRITNLYTVAHFYRYLYKDRRYQLFLTGAYAQHFEPNVAFEARRGGRPLFERWLEQLLAALP